MAVFYYTKMTFAPQSEQSIGTISSVLTQNIIHHVENDGLHQYLHIQEECKNQLPVTTETKQLIVPLTNVNVDVVQFDKSFITLGVDVEYNMTTTDIIYDYSIDSSLTDNEKKAMEIIYKGCQMLIGLKNSSDCLRSRAVYHKGKLVTGTLQDNASAESFLYHTYLPEGMLKNRKGIHTIAKAVDENDVSSICGTFVSLYELLQAQKAGGKLTVTFNFIIPFNDVLVFQQFKEYPSTIFGALELYFRFNKDAFVYKQSEPLEGIKNYMKRRFDQYNGYSEIVQEKLDKFPLFIKYSREYEQIGDPIRMINKIRPTVGDGPSVGIAEYTIDPQRINIHNCSVTIVGYKQSPEALEADRQRFITEPWVEFSQNIQYLPFSSSITKNGLSITQQSYLNNVTDFILTFPRTDRQVTVSKNPMLNELSISTMSRKYPELPLDTTSERFAAMMLNASELRLDQPRKEYVNSISVSRGNDHGAITPTRDLTSFLVTIKVERPSAMGLIFDGLDSDGKSVSIRVDAKHKYTDELDDYGNDNPPPVLYTVNDSFFIFSSRNGGECIYSDRDFNTIVTHFASGALE